MTAMAAVAMGVAFTSCSHNTDLYGGEEGGGKINGRTVQEQIELDKAVYKASFEKAFGKVAPTVDWGFGGYTRAMTRTINSGWDGWATAPSNDDFVTTMPEREIAVFSREQGNDTYGQGSVMKEFILKETTETQKVEPYNGNFTFYITGTKSINFTNPADAADHMYFYVLPGADLTFTNFFSLQKPQDFKMYIASGATVRFPAGENSNIQMYNRGTVIISGSNQSGVYGHGIIFNEGEMTFEGTSTDWDSSIPPYGAHVSGALVIHNAESQIVNSGTLTSKGLRIEGSGHFRNFGNATINGYTIVNSNECSWINDGTFTTTNFRYTAGSHDVINNCKLFVNEDFTIITGDGDYLFQVDGGGSVQTTNFYGGGTNGGPFKVNMGSKAIFKVTNEAHLNALGSAIATQHYGFEGVGTDYAVLQAEKIIQDKIGEGNVAYSGKMYVSAGEHFAQGYSGTYPYIHYYNGCTEDNIYAPGFKSGKPAIKIPAKGCSIGFEGDGEETEPETYRVIAEDWSAKGQSDFDFNDVVFDVDPRDDGFGGAKITIFAAGGIWPLKVNGREVHGLLGFGTRDVSYTLNGKDYVCYRMINTGVTGEKGASTPTTDKKDMPFFTVDSEEGYWDWDSDENIRKSIKEKIVVTVSLYDKGEDEIPAEEVVLPAEQGEVACKILVDQDCDINSEYETLANKNNKFREYVGGTFHGKWWK